MWHTVIILWQMRKSDLILSTSEHVRYGWHSFIEPILKCSGGQGLSDWLRWFGWDVVNGSKSRVTFIFGVFLGFRGVFVNFRKFFCWNIFVLFSLRLFYIVDISNMWFLKFSTPFWVPLILILRFFDAFYRPGSKFFQPFPLNLSKSKVLWNFWI